MEVVSTLVDMMFTMTDYDYFSAYDTADFIVAWLLGQHILIFDIVFHYWFVCTDASIFLKLLSWLFSLYNLYCRGLRQFSVTRKCFMVDINIPRM